ncbi:MAG: hypothetical protein V3S03_06450 [Vicinamibacteria bacterium]
MSFRAIPWLIAFTVTVVHLAGPDPAQAAGPLVLFGGRLRLGGEASGTVAPPDEGYFNFIAYDDYGDFVLRRFRASLSAELRLGGHAAILGEIRSDNLRAPVVYALFLRVRPWAGKALDLQAGIVPPVFGAFARRRYVWDNPLPGLPLVYQYLTTLRADAVPASAEELLSMRGRGWEVGYSVGAPYQGPGVPQLHAEVWDTGVQVRIGARPVALAVSLTQGTLGHPLVGDNNDGKQLAGRLAWSPGPQLVVGVSASRGEFLARRVTDSLPLQAGSGFDQSALGADLEYARGYWIVRAEALWSRWRLPPLDATRIETPQDSLGAFLEARYKLQPGLYLAGRVGRLSFSRLSSRSGGDTWDAGVTRLEIGAGYALHRQVLLKTAWQYNWRDSSRFRSEGFIAAQVVLWF